MNEKLNEHVICIGAGQASLSCAAKLRGLGWSGAITLIGEEPHLPYQRPPLSKKYLTGEMPAERFVLNAGGLRLSALVANGEPAPANTIMFEVFSDERDQFGNRTKILGGARPSVVIRLNSGIYHLVSTYGDANAVVSTDVTVEAGKLTEATVAHAVGKATFKLVMRAGGEALADTQWQITTPQGDVIKESGGALPTHMLAPGNYVVNATSQGRTFRREFTLQHSDALQVEVVVQ